MSFHVYILRCIDNSYYTGHTDDLQRRMAQHDAGEIPGYTEGRRPLRLVFSQEFPTRQEALAAEQRLKGWSRAKKEALIIGNWERVQLLARNHQSGEPAQVVLQHRGERDTFPKPGDEDRVTP